MVATNDLSFQNSYEKFNIIMFSFSFFADAPRVDLTLGKSISPGSIYEGGDVYFDCLVIASPKPYKILWFQDVSIIIHTHSKIFMT